MSTAIKAYGVSGTFAPLRKFIPPVLDGLQLWSELNTDIERCAANFAPERPNGTVVGPLSVFSAYAQCQGNVQYVRSAVPEPTEATLWCVAKAPAVPSSAAPLISTLQSSSTPPFISLEIGTTGVVRFTDVRNNAGAVQQNVATLSVQDLSTWAMYRVTMPNDGVNHTTLTNVTTSESIQANSINPRVTGTQNLHIGSGVARPASVGVSHIAFVAAYSRVLTPDEITATEARIRAVLAQFGITV